MHILLNVLCGYKSCSTRGGRKCCAMDGYQAYMYMYRCVIFNHTCAATKQSSVAPPDLQLAPEFRGPTHRSIRAVPRQLQAVYFLILINSAAWKCWHFLRTRFVCMILISSGKKSAGPRVAVPRHTMYRIHRRCCDVTPCRNCSDAKLTMTLRIPAFCHIPQEDRSPYRTHSRPLRPLRMLYPSTEATSCNRDMSTT